MRNKIALLIKDKFSRDVLWSSASFLVMGVSGILLNVLILAVYGVDTLGVFNQVYAVYIFASQIAVFGLYAPVLKYISEHSEDREKCDEIMTSALVLVAIITSAVSFCLAKLAPYLGQLFNSPQVATGIIFTIAGFWFFSINKILLSFLNGKQLMKAFAVFNIARFALLPASLLVLILLKQPGYMAPAIFSVTEILVFIALMFYSAKFFRIAPIREAKKWFREHLSFGLKSVFGGGITEMNSRVDILLLGYFLNDKMVGVYSFAAMLAEGFDQMPGIFRVNYNPIITKMVVAGKINELALVIKNFTKKIFAPSLALGLLAVAVFPVVAKIISSDQSLMAGWLVFIILIAGIVFRFGYMVFWEVLVQAGHPGYQAVLIFSVALSNVVLNLLFIPIWGIYGSAAATSLSFVLGSFYLRFMVKKVLKISI